MSSWQKVKIGDYLEKINIKGSEISNFTELEALGVSNIDGITKTSHVKSNDLSNYLYIEEDYFAYNPYRINVGSIGLTPKGIKGLVSPAYIVFKTTKYLLAEILFDFLKSKEGLFQINKLAKGTVRKTLSFEELCKIEMIIPPIEKQKEILQKQKGLKVFINDLNIEIENQQSFLKQLKQTILQEAIEGKLTANWREQNQDISTAKELLEEIKKEKTKLIKEKKIKAQKPLSPISDDEIPFDIPSSWEWCRLGDLCNYGSSPKIEPKDIDEDTWILDLEDIEKETSKLINKVRKKERDTSSTKSVFYKSDVLYSKLRPYLDKVIVADESGVCTTEILPLKFYKNIDSYFAMYSLKRKDFLIYVNSLTKGMKMPRLGTDDGKNALFAFPPLEEQKEIVATIEKLFAICDELESEIKQNKTTVDNLMATVLKEAFEE